MSDIHYHLLGNIPKTIEMPDGTKRGCRGLRRLITYVFAYQACSVSNEQIRVMLETIPKEQNAILKSWVEVVTGVPDTEVLEYMRILIAHVSHQRKICDQELCNQIIAAKNACGFILPRKKILLA